MWTLENFLAPLDPSVTVPPAQAPSPAALTVFKLHEIRDRFAEKNKLGDDDQCAALDRATVLNIYNEAIAKLAFTRNRTHHRQIASEATRKAKVVLDIIQAEPDDPVFLESGCQLAPLEPHYAQPRIQIGTDDGDDEYGHRAQWRLNAWRKEGWPSKYPVKAVWNEKQPGERLVGQGRMTDVTLRERMLEWDEKEWGGNGDDIMESPRERKPE